MTPPINPTFTEKLAVNLKFLGAAAYGFGAWAVWPSDLKGWGYGVLGVFLGLGSAILGGKAVKQMVALYVREAQLRKQLASAREPEPARLADAGGLKQAGMIDE